MGDFSLSKLKESLDYFYHLYHREEYRAYDPVSLLWEYDKAKDREIVGLWAALFAWGSRKVAIQKTRALLAAIPESPSEAVQLGLPIRVEICHRTWNAYDIQLFWNVLITLYRCYGSLGRFFWTYRQDWEEGIAKFQEAILSQAPSLQRHIGYIRKGSAAKRIQLWLRWMVRRDQIDPGPWEEIGPERLFVPLDTHLLHWARQVGLIQREIANWSVVKGITAFFQKICPEDPLKYDFSLVTAYSMKMSPEKLHSRTS
ncbi:MAG: TIGR02757 family protein [Bacteroidia bacterium]|nr:TIGR02757 family protein [Bacteroidia bacterium]MDW8134897.1 TIGR02757 family protein [Bacteroidia bacterium]